MGRGRTTGVTTCQAGIWRPGAGQLCFDLRSLGKHEENVDLRADLDRIHGRADLALIGVAISADSDDTGICIKARMSNLRLSE